MFIGFWMKFWWESVGHGLGESFKNDLLSAKVINLEFGVKEMGRSTMKMLKTNGDKMARWWT